MVFSYENDLVKSDNSFWFKKFQMLTLDIHKLHKSEAKTDFDPKFTLSTDRPMYYIILSSVIYLKRLSII